MAVLLGVDEGTQFVVEGVPVPVHLALALLVLYFLALFIAFVAADSWSEGHVGHEGLVHDAQVGAVCKLNRDALRLLVARRGEQSGRLRLLLVQAARNLGQALDELVVVGLCLGLEQILQGLFVLALPKGND